MTQHLVVLTADLLQQQGAEQNQEGKRHEAKSSGKLLRVLLMESYRLCSIPQQQAMMTRDKHLSGKLVRGLAFKILNQRLIRYVLYGWYISKF